MKLLFLLQPSLSAQTRQTVGLLSAAGEEQSEDLSLRILQFCGWSWSSRPHRFKSCHSSSLTPHFLSLCIGSVIEGLENPLKYFKNKRWTRVSRHIRGCFMLNVLLSSLITIVCLFGLEPVAGLGLFLVWTVEHLSLFLVCSRSSELLSSEAR